MHTMTEAQWETWQQERTTQQEALESLREQLAAVTHQLAVAQQRIAELERPKRPPPAFVKANLPERPKRPRAKRAPEQNQARRAETPTQVVRHLLGSCPTCAGRLSGIHIGRRRQVVDLPPPPPVSVTEHHMERGWCSYCHAWREAPLDLAGQVVGQGRLGVGIAALVVHLRQVLRAPIRLIQQGLADGHRVHLSVGAITDLLRRVAQQGRGAAEAIRDHLRASAVVHADETGWRENGRNGYIWELAAATGERYFEYHHRRAGTVINTLLGEAFRGTLVTDFYAGYNATPGGRHQRCWVHLLRDLHELRVAQVGNIEVQAWIAVITDLYARAQQITGPPEQRQRAVAGILEELTDLARLFATTKGHPCHALAQRLLRHQDELLRFALDPAIPADNNQAERGIRPLVVLRKVSGGSRSAQGSATCMTLASLVQTWRAQGRNPLHEIPRLFQSPFPQV